MSVGMSMWFLAKTLPEIFEPETYPTVLYIGANKGRCLMVPELVWCGATVDALEIYPEYVAGLREMNNERHWFRNIMEGDIRALPDKLEKQYALALWWHGPEHVDAAELPACLKQMERSATRLAVAGCPHGHLFQGPVDGNDWQRHRFDVMPSVFTDCGWEVTTLRDEPCVQSDIIAWKRL